MKLIIDIPDEVYFSHIDNEEMIRYVCEKDIITGKKKDKKTYASVIQLALLDGTPIQGNVTNEPKTGHWINAKVGKIFPSNDYKCSECGNILDFDGVNCGRGDANFCPNCGAKMRASEDM